MVRRFWELGVLMSGKDLAGTECGASTAIAVPASGKPKCLSMGVYGFTSDTKSPTQVRCCTTLTVLDMLLTMGFGEKKRTHYESVSRPNLATFQVPLHSSIQTLHRNTYPSITPSHNLLASTLAPNLDANRNAPLNFLIPQQSSKTSLSNSNDNN